MYRIPHDRRAACAASSPIRCRSGPIAAPGGRKPITCWSGWWTKPRASSASTARSCAGAISFRARRCPTRRRSAPNTTAAISPPCSTRRWRRPTMPASRSAGARAPSRGRWRGIGISCFLEHSGGSPTEGALIAFPGDGSVVARPACAIDRAGPCHRCSRASLAQRFGIAPEQVRHRHGDTNLGVKGCALGRLALGDDRGQRHRARGGGGAGKGPRRRRHQAGSRRSRHRLPRGHFEVAGTDRRLSLFDAAARAKEMAARGEIPERLDTRLTADTPLDLSQRLPHRGSRDRSRHRHGRRWSATPRWTIAATCSIPPSCKASCMAASPRALARR